MTIRIGANPLCWMNSDIPSLGSEIPVEQCISEVALIGYSGVELEDPLRKVLQMSSEILEDRNVELIGGWYGCNLLENQLSVEIKMFKDHLQFLKRHGSSLAIIADVSGSVHRDPAMPLSQRPILEMDQWKHLCMGLDALATYASEWGVKTAYHPHMGTVVQTEEEVDRLMLGTRELGLLFDTGHLIYSGSNTQILLEKHLDRVNHFHAKNVRFSVLERMLKEDCSFPDAILSGVFTVPGDNDYDDDDGLDFYPLVRLLVQGNYTGWLVMEAEQDPSIANPLSYARLGYQHLQFLLSKANLALFSKTWDDPVSKKGKITKLNAK